jgi:hypothetical protein
MVARATGAEHPQNNKGKQMETVTMTDSQLIGYLMMLSTEFSISGRDIMSQACGQAAGRILNLPPSLTNWHPANVQADQ